jgi:hypothetical protein
MNHQKSIILGLIVLTGTLIAGQQQAQASVNPYCDKVKSGESEDTGVCHDRFDYEEGDKAQCNDGSYREDPLDCPDATETVIHEDDGDFVPNDDD